MRERETRLKHGETRLCESTRWQFYETYEQQDGKLTRRLGRVEEGTDEEGEEYCREAKADKESQNSPEVGVVKHPTHCHDRT